MTTVISWFGADSKRTGQKPASLYFASDSRISWEQKDKSVVTWDHIKKVFAARTTPDIFALAGNVELAVTLVSQIVSLAEHGLLFDDKDSAKTRFGKFVFAIKRNWNSYPWPQSVDLNFMHGFRIGEGVESEFYVGVLSYFSKKQEWHEQLLLCPNAKNSSVLEGLGTGKSVALEWIEKWNNTSEGNTSRVVFSGLCDAIRSNTDKASGGAPQLVRLYRKGSGAAVGVTWCGQRYFDGQQIYKEQIAEGVEWRNDLFEIVDGVSQERISGAQVHKKPIIEQ
ncbi:hypothetical protein [Ferribacterium limneticum]|uniref:hypothetical protein n=1 Tax=Ferribacterium limneticum TaxID=76259 RepID=UPI001CFAF1DD|nr:hypothetical protein [Ferribacterium limneticum]UCV20074.1 hypothetical protein KI610_05765 [Ferribacterium limneticum]